VDSLLRPVGASIIKYIRAYVLQTFVFQGLIVTLIYGCIYALDNEALCQQFRIKPFGGHSIMWDKMCFILFVAKLSAETKINRLTHD
jgi:hypothetical protein